MWPGRTDGLGKLFAGDAFDRRFARRINFGDHQNIRLIERAAEIVPKRLRARVAVRLKKNQQPLVAAAARRFERGADFGRMMAVIVDQRDAANIPLISKRRPTPAKFRKARANQVRRER